MKTSGVRATGGMGGVKEKTVGQRKGDGTPRQFPHFL